MLATRAPQRFSSEHWVFEQQFDGLRVLCAREGDAVRIRSVQGEPLGEVFPELVTALRQASEPRFVVDGEIVAFDGAWTSFAALRPRLAGERAGATHTYLYLFDLLREGMSDLRDSPLWQRKQRLGAMFRFTDPLRFSEHREGDGAASFDQACANGWNGLIAKRTNAPYRAGRSPDWLSLETVSEQDFVVGGFTEPFGRSCGLGALLLGYYPQGSVVLRYAGKVGIGSSAPMRRELLGQLQWLGQSGVPFVDTVDEPAVHWVEPSLVVRVRFGGRQDGLLRNSRLAGVRTDKRATEVVRVPC